MHGLMTICHEAPKDGHTGSLWPTSLRASSLLDSTDRRRRAIPSTAIAGLMTKPSLLDHLWEGDTYAQRIQ